MSVSQPPSIAAATLLADHEVSRIAVRSVVDRIRQDATAHPERYGTPELRAAALDRWLCGYLSHATSWTPGVAVAVIQGLADGLAEVGQL